MSINIFNVQNNIFVKSFVRALTFIALSFVMFPMPVLATLEPINYEIIPGAQNSQAQTNSIQTGNNYSERVRPLSFYGLNAYEIQTHGGSSVNDSQNFGSLSNNSINKSVSAISASPSSNSIVPGGSYLNNVNSNSNNPSSIQNNSTNYQNNSNSSAVPISSGNISGTNVSINVPSISPNSELSAYYNSGNVNNLSYGNNSYEPINDNYNSFNSGSAENLSEAPVIAFGNNNYGDDYVNQSYQNDSTGLFSYINNSYVPGNYTSSVYSSKSYSNKTTQTASVYNGTFTPKKQVAQVVEAPKETPPAKVATPCQPYLKTYLGCGFGDEKSEIIN